MKTIPLHIADAAVAACEKEIQELREENARLKAIREQAYYTKPDGTIALICQDDEIARLKAEVERLRASSFVTAVPVEQYERLVKAGDRMAAALNGEYNHELPCVEEWTAAKEGKQP